ncbi:MAG: hypothetical protein ACR2KV_01120 [Solirubrobacteraceae bacterium]
MSALARLAAALVAEGGLLAAALSAGRAPAEENGWSPSVVVAAGPRAAAAPDAYELLVEAIYEGYRQHYGAPRLLGGADPDLRLLAGDRFYAFGLERLVGLGDLEAVVELADVISLCALVHARGAGELAESVWAAGARAVGWGGSPAHDRAKALLLTGDDRGPAALAAALAAPEAPGR